MKGGEREKKGKQMAPRYFHWLCDITKINISCVEQAMIDNYGDVVCGLKYICINKLDDHNSQMCPL